MCGRYTASDPDAIVDYFEADYVAPFHAPNYNCAPTQSLPVILNQTPKQIDCLKWGLIPHWAKDEKIAYKMINARLETLAEKPTFKSLLKSKRCLVLADGFYEWKKVGKVKLPMRFTMANKSPFAFAGLWAEWQGTKTFTIITTAANELLAPFHDRMPVILRREDFVAWLDSGSLEVCRSYPADLMAVREASPRVNSVKNNDASLIG